MPIRDSRRGAVQIRSPTSGSSRYVAPASSSTSSIYAAQRVITGASNAARIVDLRLNSGWRSKSLRIDVASSSQNALFEQFDRVARVEGD